MPKQKQAEPSHQASCRTALLNLLTDDGPGAYDNAEPRILNALGLGSFTDPSHRWGRWREHDKCKAVDVLSQEVNRLRTVKKSVYLVRFRFEGYILLVADSSLGPSSYGSTIWWHNREPKLGTLPPIGRGIDLVWEHVEGIPRLHLYARADGKGSQSLARQTMLRPGALKETTTVGGLATLVDVGLGRESFVYDESLGRMSGIDLTFEMRLLNPGRGKGITSTTGMIPNTTFPLLFTIRSLLSPSPTIPRSVVALDSQESVRDGVVAAVTQMMENLGRIAEVKAIPSVNLRTGFEIAVVEASSAVGSDASGTTFTELTWGDWFETSILSESSIEVGSYFTYPARANIPKPKLLAADTIEELGVYSSGFEATEVPDDETTEIRLSGRPAKILPKEAILDVAARSFGGSIANAELKSTREVTIGPSKLLMMVWRIETSKFVNPLRTCDVEIPVRVITATDEAEADAEVDAPPAGNSTTGRTAGPHRFKPVARHNQL